MKFYNYNYDYCTEDDDYDDDYGEGVLMSMRIAVYFVWVREGTCLIISV